MAHSERLAAGTRLGRYEIVAFVDAGGMGEVYRARDTELDRMVAIKVLPAAMVDRADRLHRFEVEARAAAALNHPNILAIYDVGQHDGLPYLVTEWLDGATLRAALDGPPLPLRRAIGYGVQIADALAAAHDRGVVHRDIKPENIFVTTDDRLKVLDFGLAKLIKSDDSGRTATIAGAVLGTLGYLSPEQASGRPADHRADIFSLGAVLFELVTHRRAFTGKTPTETLAAILEHDPVADVPPARGPRARVLSLIGRCLDKAPERRFQSARDLSMVLANEVDDAGPADVQSAGRNPFRRRYAAAGVALAVAAGALWIWSARAASTPAVGGAVDPDRELRRLTLSLPSDLPITYGSPVALSPDGRQVAVVLGDAQRLSLRPFDRDALEELPGTDGAEFPFFSPDGAWLGFWARNRLWKAPLRGGAPIRLADSIDAPFRGADWHAGTILFAPLALGPLSMVDAAGGAVRTATTLDHARGEYSHRWPQVLPGGRAWLYTALSGPVPGGVAAVMLHVPGSGETHELLANAIYARYVGDGLLVFVRDGQLFVTRFDVERLVVAGEPAAVPDPIAMRSVSGATLVSVAVDGSAVFVKSAPENSRRLVWVDRTGVEQPTNTSAASYSAPRLSPDGRRVAVTIRGSLGSGDVWTIDLSTQVRTRLTTDGRANGVVEWSPDGRRVIAGMPRLATETSAPPRGLTQGPSNLFVMTADGVGAAEALLPAPSGAGDAPAVHPSYVGSWGRDDIVTFGYGTDLWSFRVGDRAARPIMTLPGLQVGPRVSPNGRWLAYVSNESGRFEVFLTTYPQPGRRWQVSDGGGQEVVWSRDSRELYFRQHQRLMAVAIDARGTPNGRPRAIVEGRYFSEPNNPGIPHFDVGADGRFLMVSSEAGPPDEVQVVLGWRSYLAGLLAAAR